jgi:hypothetical protein
MSKEEYEELVKNAHPNSIVGGLRSVNDTLDRIILKLDKYLEEIRK